MPISKWKRRCLTGVAFVAILGTIDYAVDFALTPYNGLSHVIWQDFRRTDDIDLIYVGTSLGSRSYVPTTFDQVTGMSTFNLSSNGQRLSDSYKAIQTAIHDKHINYVVLNLEYGQRIQSINSTVVYNRAMVEDKGPLEKLMNTASVCRSVGLKKKESIQVLFPWVFDHVTPGHVLDNIKVKMNPERDVSWKSHWEHYIGQGSFQGSGMVNVHLKSNKGLKQVYKVKDASGIFPDRVFEDLGRICELCNANNVKLMVTFSPKPVFSILGVAKEHFEFDKKLKQFFASYGVPYYDFVLLKSDRFHNSDDYYYDHEHPNPEGSINFTMAFADFFKHWKAGDPVDDYFYTPEEYLASIHYIDASYFNNNVKEQGIQLHGISLNGIGITPEFEYQLWDDQSKRYQTIREYSQNPDFTFVPLQKGKYKLRLNVRQAGSSVLQEQYFEKTVSF